VAGTFFERLDRARILRRVTRTGADVREAESLEELAHRALVVGDAEALQDDALQVDPPPAREAVHGPVRPSLDELRDLGTLLLREARLSAFGPGVHEPLGAVRVEPMHPVAQRLPVHPANPGRIRPVHAVQDRSQREKPTALVRVLRRGGKPPEFGRRIVPSQVYR
jgi:hypothetical protein